LFSFAFLALFNNQIMLAHNYIRTSIGRSQGKGKHVEMLQCVFDLMEQVSRQHGGGGREGVARMALERERLCRMYGMGMVDVGGEVGVGGEGGGEGGKPEQGVARRTLRKSEHAVEGGGGGGGGGGVTRKEVRAWCRQEYGNGWWDVATLVKKERMVRAKEALTREQYR